MARISPRGVIAGVRDFVLLRAYWGYYVVSALFVAEITVTGISFYSFSLYVRAWQNDPAFAFTTAKVTFHFTSNPVGLAGEVVQYVKSLSQGWSLAAINFSLTMSVVLVFFSPFLGRFVDLRGAKIVMLIGVPLVAASLFLRAFMTEVWHLWLLQLLLGLGSSAAFIGTGKLVGMWFQRRRGLIMGFTMAGNNAGGIIMAPLSAYLISTVGWRQMFIIFGGLMFVVNFVTIFFFIRDKMEDVAKAARKAGRREELEAAEAMSSPGALPGPGGAPSGGPPQGSIYVGWQWREAIWTKAFWLIGLAQLASSISVFSILNQLGKHLEIVGINIAVAGSTLGLLGLFGLCGKFIFGYTAEKVPARFVFAFCLGLQVIGLLILLNVTSVEKAWLLVPFVAVYGLGFGAMGVLQPLLMLETFGLIAFATITGVLQLILSPFSAMTPTAVGAVVDATGTYFPVMTAGLFFLGVGATAIIFARPPVKAAPPEPQ